MKLTIPFKLLTTPEQKKLLLELMQKFNAAASHAAKCGFNNDVFSVPSIHRLCYYELRASYGLMAQMAVRAIGKAAECFQRDRAVCPVFKPTSAVVLDHKLFRFKGIDKVSIATLSGRILLPVMFGEYQRSKFNRLKGQADLIYKKETKEFYIYATAELPDGTPITTKTALGVDLGIINIATDSDENTYTGDLVERCRARFSKLRKGLQKAGTRSAKRHLVKIRKKEANFRKSINHVISKKLVALAKGTCRSLALENLKGIQKRVTVRAKQRAKHHSWSFSQLRKFVEYKAILSGVPVAVVSAKNTSRKCSCCGYCVKANRSSQSKFSCIKCGHSANADCNAAINIARAAVNQPFVSSALLGKTG